MSALTAPRVTGIHMVLKTMYAPIAAGQKIYKGALCGWKNGYLYNWANDDPDLAHPCIAIPDLADNPANPMADSFTATNRVVDNTDGDDGDLTIAVDFVQEKILYPFANDTGSPITAAHVGRDAWGLDNQSVTASPGSRSRVGTPWIIVATGHSMGYRPGVYVELTGGPGGTGEVTAVELASTAVGSGSALVGYSDEAALTTADTVEEALDELYPLVLAGMPVFKRTVTVGHADLTEGTNNTSQAINIGATLPANARIVGVDMRSLTAFSGGSATAVTCDVGTSGDIDALIDGADLFAAAVDGGPATMPQGVRPNKTFASAGAQLIATFLTDSGHNLEGLTAGSVVIEVFYTVLA